MNYIVIEKFKKNSSIKYRFNKIILELIKNNTIKKENKN